MTTSDGDYPVILHLGRVPFFGGVERVVLEAMRQSAERGYRPMLACPDGGELAGQVRGAGFEVVDIPFERMQATRNPLRIAAYARSLVREGRRLEEMCRQRRVALLHVHHPVTAAYAVRSVRRLGIPMVMHAHEALPPHRAYRAAAAYAVPHAAAIVCASGAVREMCRGLGFPEDRMTLVYNAVSEVFLGEPPAPASDLTGPRPRIAIFGVISPNKGQTLFLQSAATVAERHPQARFFVVGDIGYETDRAYLAEARALAERNPLAGRVTFTGHRTDVAALMAGMDVVTMNSTIPEAFGLVALEAMALGVKVAAPNHGASPEFIRDGVTGSLFTPGDPDALAASILWLLEAPAAAGLGPAGREYVRANLTPDKFGRHLCEVYSGVLHRRGPAPVANP